MVGRIYGRRKSIPGGGGGGGDGSVSVIGRGPLWWSNPARAAREVRLGGTIALPHSDH